MSTKIILNCKRCGYRYAFYSSNIPNVNGQSFDCPNCRAEIDSRMKLNISTAAGAFEKANLDFKNEQGEQLFVMSLEIVETPDQSK